LRKFLNKYIDPKKLVTGLLQVTIVGLFLLLWNNLNQLRDFLWPILIYSVTVPIIPTIVILIIAQFFIHKELLKFQVKFGKKKSISIKEWLITTDKTNPQWTAIKEINLNSGLLTFAKCNIFLKTNYLRFGFKILDKYAHTFGTNGILNNENNGLFHIGNGKGEDKLYITCYKNGIKDGSDIFCGSFSSGTSIKLDLKINNNNNLEFNVNGQKYYQALIKTEYRERLILMAWGDGNEYEMIVKDIEVMTKE
jgi:hypothetical protein